jgi:ribonuclease P protein component
MLRHTFNKEERLTSQKIIKQLFDRKAVFSFFQFPFKVIFLPTPLPTEHYAAQVLISVPKKHFKKSVARKRTTRLIRECYRLQKHLLYEALKSNQLSGAIMLIYITPEEIEFEKLQTCMARICTELIPSYKAKS